VVQPGSVEVEVGRSHQKKIQCQKGEPTTREPRLQEQQAGNLDWMAQLLALAPLLACQQETHAGQPGGLGQETPEQRPLELRIPEKNRPRDLQEACKIAPDHLNAHDTMAVFINRVMNRIIASKYYYRVWEPVPW